MWLRSSSAHAHGELAGRSGRIEPGIEAPAVQKMPGADYGCFVHPAQQVTSRSDKADGPTAGTATVDPLEFLARLVTHIPEPGQVMQRYYGWYAIRTLGARRGLAQSRSEDLERNDLDR
jgi:Putative transposase